MLDVIRFKCETYANRQPGSNTRLVSVKIAQLIAIGMGKELRMRSDRIRVLRAIFGDDCIFSTKDLTEAQGVPLLRWLYDLTDNGEWPDDPAVPEAKAAWLRQFASSLWVGQARPLLPEEAPA